jgi:type IV pilus assembly protein PilQ
MAGGAEMDCNIRTVNGKNKPTGTKRANSCSFVTISVKLLIAACFFCHLGCTPTGYFTKDAGIDNSPAILQDIVITGTGNNTKIEILLNKPLKYKVYNIAEPPRAVIDLSPVALNPFNTPLNVKSLLVSRIDIIKTDTDGRPVTRIIFRLKRHVEFSASTDRLNNKKIIMTVVEAAKNPAVNINEKTETPSKTSQSGNIKTAASARNIHDITKPPSNSELSSGVGTPSSPTNSTPPEAKPIKKPRLPPETKKKNQSESDKPGQDDAVMIMRSVDITRNGIAIAVNGVHDNFKFFKLASPQRLVIDVFGAKNAVDNEIVPINRFGIRSVRLGTHPDKVRIVLDAPGKIFPACRIKVDNQGIKVLF